MPEAAASPVAVTLTVGGEAVLREDVALAAVAPRTFFLMPHSHVDIGYSDPQPEVERKQWRNLKRRDRARAATTRARPPEARFHWQAEGLWAVESYLAQASEDERRATSPRPWRAATSSCPMQPARTSSRDSATRRSSRAGPTPRAV